jgi:2-phospho-L-lactate/phosphoenolpyruvate guanylyltransferase
MDRHNAMQILIPCKSLDTGKSRLSECLDPAERRVLCSQLLTGTLQRAVELAPPSRIRVVTCDADASGIASRYRIAQTPDPGRGLNAALDAGRSALLAATKADDALLVLPIDLPFGSSDAIANMLSRSSEIVIAPDESGTGTNLLLLRAAALRRLPFAYGIDSYAAHLAAARALGVSIETVRDWRLAFDIDTPAQYAAWRSWSARRRGVSVTTVTSSRSP